MPNGHGGAPFLGSAVLFAIGFAILASLPGVERYGWPYVALCLAVAAVAGWRLAYHLHMRAADEYEGAYTAADAYLRATRRYRVAAVIYAILSAAAGFGILWWRGLP